MIMRAEHAHLYVPEKTVRALYELVEQPDGFALKHWVILGYGGREKELVKLLSPSAPFRAVWDHPKRPIPSCAVSANA